MSDATPRLPALSLVFLLALGGPALLAYNAPPSATTFNQLLALAGWGAVVLAVGRRVGDGALTQGGALFLPMAAVLALVLGHIGWSWAQGLPTPLALSYAGVVGGGWLVYAAAARLHGGGDAVDDSAAMAFVSAMLTVALLSAVIACLQVFANDQVDGWLVARSVLPGRAIGNLRQPNHLSTLLLWGLVAWVPLAEAGRWWGRSLGRPLAIALAVLLVFGLVLTASRTGTLGMILLALWGLLDRRLSRSMRWTLALSPLLYLALWSGLAAWAHSTQHVFAGESRLGEGDISSSRFGIWSNTLELIRANPWWGVGWGEFNFAWTLTPFASRPPHAFDHSHNLVLQLAVEMGIPSAVLMMGLLLWAVWTAWRRAWRDTGASAGVSRAAVVMVLIVGLHSMLEYPLWYAYFLYPTIWALALALRQPATQASATSARAWRLAGGVLIFGAFVSLLDYGRVVVIFRPGNNPTPLSERVERGVRSFFHAQHAYYAQATLAEHPGQTPRAFDVATHALIDSRLLTAWARAYDERGETDKARYLADRLRDMHNPESGAFFGECKKPAADPATRPFQCDHPQGQYTWRDFMH